MSEISGTSGTSETREQATMRKVYAAAQAACGLKEGDRVRVLRRAESCEAGWDGIWHPDMDNLVGKTGRVTDTSFNGVFVYFHETENSWSFPCFILEKVAAPKPAHEFKPFDRVLVRDEDNEPWAPDIYRKHNPDVTFPHGTFKNCFRQCIPYEGNEHLAWKTEAADGE